jgi:hypothetical protein
MMDDFATAEIQIGKTSIFVRSHGARAADPFVAPL